MSIQLSTHCRVKNSIIGLLLLQGITGLAAAAGSNDYWKTAPFAVANPNPFILIHGLPAASSATLMQAGEGGLQLAFDLANNSMHSGNGRESVTLDGETHRARLVWKQGLGEGWQVGIDLPLITHSGGVMDAFIEDWHDTFGLTNSDRTLWPNNRLLFSYERSGVTEFELKENASGLGDIQLLASRTLFGDTADGLVTLNAALKLPTGDADELLGSGGAELAFWAGGATPGLLPRWRLGGFMTAGVLLMKQGDVLPDLQRKAVWFGGAGVSWQALDWLLLKTQVDAHSAFYRTDLAQLGAASVMLTVGGTIPMDGGRSAVDLAIGENLVTDTIPDFMINLAYNRRF